MVMAGGRPGCKRLRLQAVGQEAGPKPAHARQGAVAVCPGDSAEVRLLLGGREAEEEEEEGSAAEARGMEGAHKGEVPGWGGGGRGGRRRLGVTTFRSWCPHNTPVR